MADTTGTGTQQYYAGTDSGDASEDESQKIVTEERKATATVPMTIAMQPFIFARTLIQVGYEPLEPILGTSLFRRQPGYYYPNVFQYMNHIRKAENSFFVLFTGATAKVCNVISATVTDRAVEKMVRDHLPYRGDDEQAPLHRKHFSGTMYEVAVNCASKSAAVVVSHPFHVVMVRMICSVISKDQAYQGFFSTIREIYREEGLAGFFSGMTPRLLAEMFTITAGGAIMYAFYRLMSALEIEEEQVRASPNYGALAQFALSSLMYRYQLTSTVTAASCKGLHIGLPAYGGWRDVFADLRASRQLGRGASYFYRRAIL